MAVLAFRRSASPAGASAGTIRHGGTRIAIAIAIADGRIIATPPRGSRVIDLRGTTVLPVWIDARVHLESYFNAAGRIGTDTTPTPAPAPTTELLVGMADNARRTL
jgi:imidazolonepropionase-like amidohydrolase